MKNLLIIGLLFLSVFACKKIEDKTTEDILICPTTECKLISVSRHFIDFSKTDTLGNTIIDKCYFEGSEERCITKYVYHDSMMAINHIEYIGGQIYPYEVICDSLFIRHFHSKEIYRKFKIEFNEDSLFLTRKENHITIIETFVEN